MTICRQNGDVNFVGVPTGEKGVFVRAGLLSPSPPSNPENIFLGAVYRSPSLCDGDRLHSPYTKRLPCSHVLRAMGVPFTYAPGSVRLSLSRYTTEEEIDFVVENMPQVIKTLRAISPFKN
mgnify:CR=1 FL=1